MEWYNDSIYCLDAAKIFLSDIEEKLALANENDDIVPYLKVYIKNFLENCRSPLDYAAQYIFDKYCQSEYIKREKKKKKNQQNLNPKIYYPIRKKEVTFEKEISKIFFPLNNNKPEVIKVFRIGQFFSFPNEPFLYYLNTLTIENKHRHLSKQKRKEDAHIHYIKLGNGDVFQNVNVVTPNGNGVIINGLPLNSLTAKINPFIESLDATFNVGFIFKDLNLPVLPTLTKIYEGTRFIINELETVL